MNPYALLAMAAAIALAGAGGFKLGVDHEVAAQARAEKLVEEAGKKMEDAAAKAIAQLKPKYTTIQNEVQREIRTNTVFADCKLPVDSLRLVNQALNAGGAAPGGGKLPGADATR